MPHFAKDVLESDPAYLARLHEILHGRRAVEPAPAGPGKAPPTREERFGVPSSPRPATVRRHTTLHSERD